MTVAKEHMGNIVADCVSTSTDQNGSEDEDHQANGSLDTEEKPFPKKQKALQMVYRFFEFLTDIDQSIFDKIYELEKHA